MEIKTLSELLTRDLIGLLVVQAQFVKGLERMKETASDARLKAAFSSQIEKALARVRDLGDLTGETHVPGGNYHELIRDCYEASRCTAPSEVRDLVMAASARPVLYWSVAKCRTITACALWLGKNDAFTLVAEIARQDQEADHLLEALQADIIKKQSTLALEHA